MYTRANVLVAQGDSHYHIIASVPNTTFLKSELHWPKTRLCTEVDLSKILGGPKKFWGKEMAKSDKCMGISQLLGARAWTAPLSLRLCAYEL